MQKIKSEFEELFELSRHTKSIDRRADRKGVSERAPAFSMQDPNYVQFLKPKRRFRNLNADS